MMIVALIIDYNCDAEQSHLSSTIPSCEICIPDHSSDRMACGAILYTSV